MNLIKLLLLFVSTIISLFPVTSFSQSGPGGVGSVSDNGLWFKADDITQADNTPVVKWYNRSGNNNDAYNNLAADHLV